MSSIPQAQPPERQIDWVRAAFTGSVAGGVLWGIVVKVLSILNKTLSMDIRLLYAAGGVCLLVLLSGLVIYRLVRRRAVRTYAVVLLIAPCTGLFLLLLLLAIGLPGMLTRS